MGLILAVKALSFPTIPLGESVPSPLLCFLRDSPKGVSIASFIFPPARGESCGSGRGSSLSFFGFPSQSEGSHSYFLQGKAFSFGRVSLVAGLQLDGASREKVPTARAIS